MTAMFAYLLPPVITIGKLLSTASAPRGKVVAPDTTLYPERVPTTERREGQTLDTTQRPLLERVDVFVRRHPGFTIAAPYNTLSGLWEVRAGDSTTGYDNGFRM